MTPEIAVVYLILAISFVLFVSEWIRFDVVALLVLGALAVTGLVTTDEALSGFSNPAVITVWAMFIISQGLSNTGIARRIGGGILSLAGRGEVALIAFITFTAATLSAFMNNIGVAALLLPVTVDISKTTGISASRLLMPMAYGSLLGGLTTLVGTPPNLLVSMSLRQSGFAGFELFDFAAIGIPIVVGGIGFFLLIGRHVLPRQSPSAEMRFRGTEDLRSRYRLDERTFVLRIPAGSRLAGRSIEDSQLARIAGLRIVALLHDGHARFMPPPNTRLLAGEELLVQGRVERLDRLRDWGGLGVSREAVVLTDLVSDEVLLFEVRVAESSSLVGDRIYPIDFHERFRGNLLAVRRDHEIHRARLSERELEPGDRLLVQGGRETLDLLESSGLFDECFRVSDKVLVDEYDLPQQNFVIRIPSDSGLVGQTIEASGISHLFDFRLLGLIRDGNLRVMPDRDEPIRAEDRLLIHGTAREVDVLRAFQDLEIDTKPAPDLGALEAEKMQLMELMLDPRSSLAGQRIDDLRLEDKYGVEILAVWREGRAYRSSLGDMSLELGDAFLVFGPREKLELLEDEADFIALTPISPAPPKREKAWIAGTILGAIVLAVLAGWLSIAVAAVIGSALMVLAGCLTMEEAYRAIDWRAIFLIAGMLPLGIALESSGAAAYLAVTVMNLLSGGGAWAVIFAFYGVTAVATLFVPTAALVVIMAPVVMTASAQMGFAPQTAMMAIAIAASASFASPVSHPANLLVMGPGGYKFADYLKLGLPLTAFVWLITALLLPFVWPLQRA